MHRYWLWAGLLLLLLGGFPASADITFLRNKTPAPTGGITFVQNGGTSADTPSTTTALTLTGVGTGSLIVLWIKWENTTTTVTASDGTSSFTMGTTTSHASGFMGAFGYLLVANSGTRTYTVTFGAVREYRRLHVWEFSYTGTMSFDTQATGSGSGTACASGAMTTTGTTGLVLGGYGEFAAVTISSPLVNGVAATGVRSNNPAGSYAATWYRLLTAPFSGGTASATLGSSQAWICNGIAFKAT